MEPELEKLVVEAEAFTSLIQHPGWRILLQKISEKTDALRKASETGPVTDLSTASYYNGRLAGLEYPATIVSETINKAREVTE